MNITKNINKMEKIILTQEELEREIKRAFVHGQGNAGSDPAYPPQFDFLSTPDGRGQTPTASGRVCNLARPPTAGMVGTDFG